MMSRTRKATLRGRWTSSLTATVVLAAAFVGLASSMPAPARAAADAGHDRMRVRHLAFRPLATMNVLVDGPDVLLGGRVLIDERTNSTTSITPPPGCGAVAIGGSRIAADCVVGSQVTAGPHPALYSISTGAWTAVALAPSIATTCATADGCQITGVGRYWLAISEQLCYHCASPTVFQNLTTGQVSADPTAARILPDLSSRTLAAPLCSPLRVPHGPMDSYDDSAPPFGSLLFAGRFAVVIKPTSALSSTTYVQRCGSPSRTFVCHCSPNVTGNFRTVVANAQVVIWAPPVPLDTPLGTAVTHLDGMYLPSRRRFVIPLPPATRARGIESVLLSSRTLYIQNSGDGSQTFSAPSPR